MSQDTATLAGKRVVCIGASAGIGRAFAALAMDQGAQVLAVARRKGELEQLCADGQGKFVVADMSNVASVSTIAAAATDALGLIDLVFFSAGSAPLRRLGDVDDADWDSVLQTNVVGAHRAIRALLPLMAPGGIVAVLSSESVGESRAGLAVYSASKAALEQLMRSCRAEHPGTRFSTVVVGATTPTEFSNSFDPDLLGEILTEWAAHGHLPAATMPTQEVAEALTGILATMHAAPGINIDEFVIRAPAPSVPTVG